MGKQIIKKGEKYGKLDVLVDLGVKRVGAQGNLGKYGCYHMYLVKCEKCGRELELPDYIVRKGYSKRCNCTSVSSKSGGAKIKHGDIIGNIKVFSLRYIDNDGARIYNCKCTKCLSPFMASEENILSGNVVCGCNKDAFGVNGIRRRDRYGKLIVMYPDPKDNESHICRCVKCRLEASVKNKRIIEQGDMDCFCYKVDNPEEKMNNVKENCIGEVHGFLKIIQYSDEQCSGMGSSYWDCLCLNCGNIIYGIRLCDLKLGHRQSCGCLDNLHIDFGNPRYSWQHVINQFDYEEMKQLKVRPMVPIITDKEIGYDNFAFNKFEPTRKEVIYG